MKRKQYSLRSGRSSSPLRSLDDLKKIKLETNVTENKILVKLEEKVEEPKAESPVPESIKESSSKESESSLDSSISLDNESDSTPKTTIDLIDSSDSEIEQQKLPENGFLLPFLIKMQQKIKSFCGLN